MLTITLSPVPDDVKEVMLMGNPLDSDIFIPICTITAPSQQTAALEPPTSL